MPGCEHAHLDFSLSPAWAEMLKSINEPLDVDADGYGRSRMLPRVIIDGEEDDVAGPWEIHWCTLDGKTRGTFNQQHYDVHADDSHDSAAAVADELNRRFTHRYHYAARPRPISPRIELP